jgi:VanZ family protein
MNSDKPLSTRPKTRWFAVVAWMALIFYMSAQPTLPLLANIAGEAESLLGHFMEYGVLALLLRWALGGVGVKRAALWAFALAVMYALTDEFHQHFVPGRHMDPVDLLTDAAGAALALWLASRIVARRTAGTTDRRRQPDEPV